MAIKKPMIAAHVTPELREQLRALGEKLRRSRSDTLRLLVEMVLCDGIEEAAVRLNAFASGTMKGPARVKITAERFMELLRQAAEETGYMMAPPKQSGDKAGQDKSEQQLEHE